MVLVACGALQHILFFADVGTQMGYGDGLEMFLGAAATYAVFFLCLSAQKGFFDLQVGMVGGVALGHRWAWSAEWH